MATQALPFISPDEYLALDRAAECRSEYVDGQMYAMSGGTRRHAAIISNLNIAVGSQLGEACQVFSSDLRLHVEKTNAFFYPDLLVACGAARADDLKDIIDTPRVLIEVASKSSANYDRGVKFSHYRTIPSLNDYLIVDQFQLLVEHYSRQPDNAWRFREYNSMTDAIELPSIGARLNLADVYRRVEFT